ncbi:MAG: ferredoxin [Actinobacteria bacterium]|nr:ferredoxin [Actinomycetota bacterium]
MKVRLDDELCVGHGRCYALAPDVFDADDQGHCVLRFDDEDLPERFVDVAKQAVANCPEDALAMEG